MPSRRSPSLLLVLALLAAACTGTAAEPGDGTTVTIVPTTSTAPPTTTTTLPGAEGFLRAIAASLAGTGYAGAAETDRRALLDAGSGVCALLERGLTVDDVLVVLAVTLELGSEEASDDVVLAAGLVGAATEHLCPGRAAADDGR